MSHAEDSVSLSIESAVAVVTLNRPRVLNAIDANAAAAFAAVMDRLASEPAVRALLLVGEGRSFCAGGDVARFAGSDPASAIDAIIDPLHRGLRTLDRLGIPSVAAVQGAAAGAGFSLAIACDFCIAAENAVFTLAYPRLGASPDGSATYHLPRLVGRRKALELAILSKPLPAAEALALGLVNRVVPTAALREEAQGLALRLAAGPTAAYARIKDLIGSSLANDLGSQLDRERAAFLAGVNTADFAEGVAALLAKRAPRFTGR